MQTSYMCRVRLSERKIKAVKYFSLALLLFIIGCDDEKIFMKENFFSLTTTKSERENFVKKTIEETIHKNLSQELTVETEEDYESALWAMELMLFRNSFTDSVFSSIIKKIDATSTSFQRAFLEAVYTLYINDFKNEIEYFVKTTNNPKIFAMCCNYLFQNGMNTRSLIENYKTNYPEYASHPIITMLEIHLLNEKTETPALKELLAHQFEKDKITLFSLQRNDRNYPGIILIRNADGKFVRDRDGKIFHVSQLARAISNLPGYITNGNTPQGIFSIYGIDTSQNVFIGPSPNLQIRMPFEVEPKTFFHNDASDSTWKIEHYKNLLPDTWKNYKNIYEAFFAGKAGRTEIISHGTTIDTRFYESKSYYPYTPSLGCLVTKEIWSDSSGRLVESDQLKLMNELAKLPHLNGYFVVVNIDDKKEAVRIEEIENIIQTIGR